MGAGGGGVDFLSEKRNVDSILIPKIYADQSMNKNGDRLGWTVCLKQGVGWGGVSLKNKTSCFVNAFGSEGKTKI